jgi:glycosyltransferase involved in cell wall biosynthesis
MAAGTSPDISVVVPVRNGERSLPALLRSLEAQTFPRERFEVVVVDNGSTDRTAEIARAHGALVVAEPKPNRSGARNAGARAAHAGLFAFTDADCEADRGWLAAFWDCRTEAPLVAGDVSVSTGDPPNAVERFESLWRFGQEHWVNEGWAATANLLVERRAFDAVGGFDTSWRHIGEDADFCLRAGRAGLALGWCPHAVVSHYAEDELWTMLKRAFFHGYSVNQAWYRLGAGFRAWRRPWPAVAGDDALRQLGSTPDGFERAEWKRMRRLARAAYGMRVAGSLWAEAQRAR